MMGRVRGLTWCSGFTVGGCCCGLSLVCPDVVRRLHMLVFSTLTYRFGGANLEVSALCCEFAGAVLVGTVLSCELGGAYLVVSADLLVSVNLLVSVSCTLGAAASLVLCCRFGDSVRLVGICVVRCSQVGSSVLGRGSV